VEGPILRNVRYSLDAVNFQPFGDVAEGVASVDNRTLSFFCLVGCRNDLSQVWEGKCVGSAEEDCKATEELVDVLVCVADRKNVSIDFLADLEADEQLSESNKVLSLVLICCVIEL
jgi:hypothetical protein